MKKAKLVLFAILAALSVSGTALVSGEVRASGGGDADKFNAVCDGDYSAEQKAAAGCKEKRTAGGVAVGVINVILSIVGVGAVVAIIYGGFTYSSSRGDPSNVARGKSIILYAVIGLIISLLAFAIVNFVVGEIF